jgi:TPR repeat protein
MNALGYAYENGLGVEQSYGEAATWYRKSVDAGNESGINNLARLQRAGLGMPKDAAQARALFEKASARGASDATCNLAGMLVAGEGGALDMQRGYALMQQAADKGDASCALNLGIGYRYGDVGIDPDMDKARHYLQVAEEQHLDEATAQLTEMTMFEHEDDEQEVRAGFAVLTRLADAGGTRAKFLLGEACLLGRPWPRDPACARQRFREAGEQGFRAGASNLGLLLEAGIGGPVDLEGAEVWFRKAIDLGVGDSRYELGRLLLHKGRTKEALDNLVAVAGDGSRLPMYVVMRWCNAHPDCEVPAAKRAEFAKALADFPDDRKNVFAWGLAVDVMSDAEDGRHAVKLMESLAQTHAPGWPELDTLAAAQARAGDFDRAAATERKAIAMAPADLYRRTRRTLEERVALYDARKTCDLPY